MKRINTFVTMTFVKISNFVAMDLPGQGGVEGCVLIALFVVVLLVGMLYVTGNIDKLEAVTNTK